MRIVVKVGTSTLAHAAGLLNIRRVEGLVKVLSDLKNEGHQLVLVSSGAIGMGVGKLNLPGRPADMPTKQAAAAVGQCELMYTYDKLFGAYNHTVAQLLLTAEDVNFPRRRQNFENDAVATDEVGMSTTIGENDTLSAIVSECVGADLLILLSDIDGLYTADPRKDEHATLIPEVREITPELRALAGEPGSALGTGGMATKLKAAEIAMACGCDMVIANGQRPEQLYDIAAGRHTGTRFVGRREGQ